MRKQLLFIVSALMAIFAFLSCKGTSPPGWEVPPFRHAEIGAELFYGAAPFNWQYTVFVYPGDGDSKPTMVELATKIEVDFGDGGGYLDVTNEVVTFWQSQGPKPVHTYVEKGEYAVECRVTYYDGRAVTGKMIPLFVQVE